VTQGQMAAVLISNYYVILYRVYTANTQCPKNEMKNHKNTSCRNDSHFKTKFPTIHAWYKSINSCTKSQWQNTNSSVCRILQAKFYKQKTRI